MIADLARHVGEREARSIRDDGGQAVFSYCDVRDSASVNDLIEAAATEFGGLDVMLSNAAITRTSDFLDLSEADFDEVLRVNLRGPFLGGQAAARQMVKRGTKGAIINMSSVNAVLAIPNITPYVVAKGGLNQLTKVMAVSLADYGIRVNSIGPGSILTEMLKSVLTDEDARRRILSRTPLGWLGTPEEVAGVAVFLASDDSSYVTGQCVYVDGGRLALNYTVPVDDSFRATSSGS